MKTTTKTILALLALSLSALAIAQDFGGPPPDGNQDSRGMGPGSGPGARGIRRPPPSVLMEALDANHDGIIDANEIANAPAALKKLDKNGDGKLTPDELRPPRPPRNGQGRPSVPPGPPDGDNQNGPPHRDGQGPQPGGPPGN